MATKVLGFAATQQIKYCLRSAAKPKTCLFIGSQRSLSTTSRLLLERYYSEKHEWVSVKDDVGTVGITNYAQEQLGEVVYAQLPELEAEVSQDEEVGALESVKAASEVFTPVSGTILEGNTALEDKPGLVNESCYDEGWIFKLKLSNMDELKELMDEEGYNNFLKNME